MKQSISKHAMLKNHLTKKLKQGLSKVSLLPLVLVAFLVMISVAIGTVESTNDAEKATALQDAVMRSALHCYSLEGAYPAELTYLEENYNLAINHDQYIVHYELFASNIAPDITVIAKQKGGTA